jgi:hypothetical protein
MCEPVPVATEGAGALLEVSTIGVSERSKPHSKPVCDDRLYGHLFTLDQLAAMVSRKKKTLERWLKDQKLPDADQQGGGGKAAFWRYGSVREALARESGRKTADVDEAAKSAFQVEQHRLTRANPR